MTNMTMDFIGELKWTGSARKSAPLIVDSLIKDQSGKRIVINFHCKGDGLNDPYNAQESATIWDRKKRSLLQSGPNISLFDPCELVYQTQRFRPYKKKDHLSIMLLLILKELSDCKGEQYCYVVAHWTEDGAVYECSGLLKGYEVG